MEYYWQWANVTPTIALPTRRHQLGRRAAAHSLTRRHHITNVTTVAQPYCLRWASVTPSQLGCVGYTSTIDKMGC